MIALYKRLLHFIDHLLGRNTGHLVTFKEDGYIFVGFECDTCKKIDQKTLEKINEKDFYDRCEPDRLDD